MTSDHAVVQEKPKKPPLGVRPRWVLDEERFTELLEGINRHWNMNILPPLEWIEELLEVGERLQDHRDT